MSRRAVISVAFAFLTVWPVVHTFGTPALFSTVQDDFYYYAIVADHIAHRGHATFDGVTLTNGYHPLWMAVLVVLARLAGGIGPWFFALVAAVEAASSLLCSWLLLRLGAALKLESLAAWLVAQTAVSELLSTGMECVVELPLHLCLLLVIARARGLDISGRQAVGVGALASLLVLARLDAALLVLLVIVLALRGGTKLRRLVPFALGAATLALYVAGNLSMTGHLMPVSAQSKQLVRSLGVSPWPLLVFFYSPWLLPWLLATLFGRKPVPLNTQQQLSARAALWFPVLAMAAQSLLSPWVTWPWHFYWLPPFVLVAAGSLRRPWALAAALAVTVVSPLYRFHIQAEASASPTWIAHHAEQLADFARTHPGRYAMGDRAGLTAYLLGQPLVQLEGLIADQKMVEHIRQEDDLPAVLREYGVNYLIVTVYRPLPEIDGCYRVEVPDLGQAGARARRMQGQFCTEPLLHFETPAGSWLFPRADSYVFAVDAPWH
jgi:hypothetical protein